MSKRFITVYRGSLLPQVEIVKSALESEGIVCMIKGAVSFRPDISYATGIELQVQEEDKERAEKIIKESDK